jgi:sorting nexin-8
MAISGTSELAAKPPQRATTPPPDPTLVSGSAQKPRNLRKDSLEFPEADPWGSPAMHRGHNHEANPPKPNGISRKTSNGVDEPVRTTSNFTTGSVEESNASSNQPPGNPSSAPTIGGWGSTFEGTGGGDFGNTAEPTIGGGAFGNPGDGADGPPSVPNRSFGGGRVTTGGVEENVVITLLPEKEGVFMFQHHNYQVASARRGSKVIRRYSDFVWLLDCLQKRYPFRQLPLLPPKRVGGKTLLLLEF